MIIFLIFLAILYLVLVLAVTLPYWYERGNTFCEDIPSPPYTPRAVVKLCMASAASALLLGLAFPLDPIMRHIEGHDEQEDKENLPPVLLVHGLYHHPSGWLFLRRQLRKAGFRKIYTMAYSSWKTDIAAVTAKLESSVWNLERRHPGKKMLLVGHSLGGLIIRNWLANADNQKRAVGAVTLGAPHRGSKLAALACGALGRSLLPTNPFFADLARNENPATIPCVSLVSEADTMVLPQQNLIPVTGGWAMRLAPYATHVGMMAKGAVLRMAVWELHRMIAETADKHEKKTPAPGKAAPAAAATVENPSAPAAAPEEKAAAVPESAAKARTKAKAKPAAKDVKKPAGSKRAAVKKAAPVKKSAKE